MEDIWQRIEAWLATNAPDVLTSFRPGAFPGDIANTETHVGISLPQDIKDALSRHDGQHPDGPGLWQAWQFLSLDGMRDEWDVWNRLAHTGGPVGWESEPGPGVASDWWNTKWVPIVANGSGDFYCLDFDPTPQGTSGQVIQVLHELGTRTVAAPSFRAWLAAYASDLEAGAYFYVTDEFGGYLE